MEEVPLYLDEVQLGTADRTSTVPRAPFEKIMVRRAQLDALYLPAPEVNNALSQECQVQCTAIPVTSARLYSIGEIPN